MVLFNSDYCEGVHPRILQRLVETNLTQTVGYGEDEYCETARQRIREAVGQPQAAVHFLVGGTQANMTVISSILRPHEGVLCAPTGHINVHETGAVEATGHKVMPIHALPGDSGAAAAIAAGKLTRELVEAALRGHREDPTYEHMVKPGMVYISQPTELGTLYSLQELQDIYRVCQEYEVPLFIDGARLSYGLASPLNDVTLQDLACLCDVFYIGGTKVGLLFGEAVVIVNPALQQDFRYLMKQRGGMLAKGRLLGVQFAEAFTDGLYLEMGRHAVNLAMRLKQGFVEKGYPLYADSPTNQQFVVLPVEKILELSRQFGFEEMAAVDETHRAVRFCTSWATEEVAVEALLAAL